ncbi:MAG: enoyl-CoA hydratase-related protein [Thermovirgaceae bacterium]|nr:enoyl-CoA hydratase-related protein [Thermovirgaceae bacterium]
MESLEVERMESLNEKNSLLVEDIGSGVLVLTINSPRTLNALDGQILQDLKGAFGVCAKDPKVRVVLLTGKGKAFVAGADISALSDFTPEQAAGFSRNGCELFDLMEKIPQPIVAVINGFALGGGLELALACDFRFAAEGAKLGLPEILLGIIPGFGGTQRLVSVAGASRAREMIFTGRRLDAAEALACGLVDRVLPAERLLDESKAFAMELATRSQSALAQAKWVLNSTRNLSLQEGLMLENQAFSRCFEHKDSREGIRAFLEKRKPEFGKP